MGCVYTTRNKDNQLEIVMDFYFMDFNEPISSKSKPKIIHGDAVVTGFVRMSGSQISVHVNFLAACHLL